MHRIDTATAEADKHGSGKDGFSEGDPQTGDPATIVSADFLDALQEEIAYTVEQSGGTLSKGDNTQLYTAIVAIATAIHTA